MKISTEISQIRVLFPRLLFDYFSYILFFAFSFWLMFKTFSYDSEKHLILFSPKIWSDFAATLPLIRSFSFGDNWPPEYPIFPGLPIQYHFLFYFFVGQLERIGVPLHWALNLPSAIGFFILLAMIYAIAKRLFDDIRVALLSVGFFLFNGSLSFFQYFAKHAELSSFFSTLLSNTEYSAMGPWDGGKVLGVWHLNVFINQRHFGVALGLLLLFIFICLRLENRSKRITLSVATLFGILIGFLPLFHKPVMLMFAVTMATFFVVLPYLRIFLFTTAGIAFVIVASLALSSFNVTGPAQDSISWYPGFTMHGTQSLLLFLSFLWQQFGLHCILAPIGFYFAPTTAKKVVAPAFFVFLIAFLLKFSPDVLANHKFINFSLIFFQMLSAYAIVVTYYKIANTLRCRQSLPARFSLFVSKMFLLFVVAFSTLSGIIDFTAIANDRYASMADVGADEKATWFLQNTPRDTIVLNSSLLYHPASIAGRKVLVGWPYFTTTAGYDHDSRFADVNAIYSGINSDRICSLLRKYNVDFITVEDTSGNNDLPRVNIRFFHDNFVPLYISSNRSYAVFSTVSVCP